jgi:NAD(P)-dependent dehydrogenase (short-subunit alcohol dehydrogenase family)
VAPVSDVRAAGLPTERELAGGAYAVTGGSMGIGLACVRELLRRGGAVAFCARGAGPLEEARAALAAEFPGAAVRAVPADVTDAAAVGRLLDAAEALGGLRGVVHAAAELGPIGRVVDVEPAEWFDAVRTNLLGAFVVARAGAARFLERGVPGSIVLFSGGGATGPFPHFTAYACGKVGVVRLAETLAQEMADTGIRVNAVAPGFVATRMHQQTLEAGDAAGADYLERTKRDLAAGGVPPELAARAVAFLLSERAAGVTGRLLAAPWDDFERWPEHASEFPGSDLFTLRRIVPRDRGRDWQ